MEDLHKSLDLILKTFHGTFRGHSVENKTRTVDLQDSVILNPE